MRTANREERLAAGADPMRVVARIIEGLAYVLALWVGLALAGCPLGDLVENPRNGPPVVLPTAPGRPALLRR